MLSEVLRSRLDAIGDGWPEGEPTMLYGLADQLAVIGWSDDKIAADLHTLFVQLTRRHRRRRRSPDDI